MRIEHLSLKNWRNFKSIEVDIGSRLFVVGPNASGKSNLLDAIRFLRDVATSGGGFQHAVKVRGDLRKVRCLAARNFNHGRVGVTIRLRSNRQGGPTWLYQLHFAGERGGLDRPIIYREVVEKDGQKIVDRPDSDDRADEERLTQTALEQVNANREFRDIAKFLSRVSYLHLVPKIVRDPELGRGRDQDPFGGDFLARVAGTQKRTRAARLSRINAALRVAVPQLEDLSLERDEAGKPHLEARYKHWHRSGAKQDERDFSDGTLRLIGLLWMIQETAGDAGRIILLEEPELSLHTTIVRQLPAIMSRAARREGTQFILSTHSTEVLEDPGLGLDEVLILQPGDEGTTATSAADLADTDALLNAGLTLAQILEPQTAPSEMDRLAFPLTHV